MRFVSPRHPIPARLAEKDYQREEDLCYPEQRRKGQIISSLRRKRWSKP
jgi:hypothetical protein